MATKLSPVTLAPMVVGNVDVTENLVGYWPFDETSGTNVPELIDNNDGTAINTPLWISGGKPDKSLFLNGLTQYVQCGNVLNQGTGDFTAMVWILASTTLTTSTNGGRVMQKRGTGSPGTQAGWQIAVYRDGTDVKLTNTIWDDGSSYHRISDATPGPGETATIVIGQVDEWIHLASVFDATNNRWKIYVDGAIAIDAAVSNLGSVTNTRGLTFGASDVSTTNYFKGAVDEGRMYSEACSDAKISAVVALGDG